MEDVLFSMVARPCHTLYNVQEETLPIELEWLTGGPFPLFGRMTVLF